MNDLERKAKFWDLELVTDISPEESHSVMIDYLQNADEVRGNFDEVLKVVNIQLENNKFTSTQLAQLYYALILQIEEGTKNVKALWFTYELIENIGNTSPEDHILKAAEVLMRFGTVLPPALLKRVSNLRSSQAKDLMSQQEFLSGRPIKARDKAEQGSFWHSVFESLLHQNVKPILTNSRAKKEKDPEELLFLWLVYQLVGKPKDKVKLSSPNHILKTNYGQKLSFPSLSFIKLCIRLDQILKSPDANQIIDFLQDLSSTPSRMGELLMVAVLYKKLDEKVSQTLKDTILNHYRHVQKPYIEMSHPDLCSILPQLLDAMTSPFEKGRGTRSLRILRSGRKAITTRVLSKINSVFINSQSYHEKLHQDFLRNLAELGLEVQDLRGGFAKIFQLGVAAEGFFPSEIKSLLQDSLHRCSPMSEEQVRSIFQVSFHASPEQIFESWDSSPFACGSIGQVHAATTPEGDQVCVKIRYPGIEEAVKNDFKSVNLVTTLFKGLFPIDNSEMLIRNWQEETIRECDYSKEAENLSLVKGVFQDNRVLVPKVYANYSNEQIITMERLRGQAFPDFVRLSNQEQRDRIGSDIIASTLQLLSNGLFRMDIHQGNYLVVEDKLAMVDLGSVFRKDKLDKIYFKDFCRAILESDLNQLREVFRKEGWKNHNKVPASVYDDIMAAFSEPYRTDLYQFTPDYAKRMVQFTISGMSQLQMPASSTPLVRFFWSLYSLLGSLEAKANWRDLMNSFVYDQPDQVEKAG